MKLRGLAGILAFACSISLATSAEAGGALGAAGLRARYGSLGAQLADNAFGGPLVLQSQEAARRLDGDVYAVLDHPFPLVSATLADPARWCDVLILHLNTKHCRRTGEGAAIRIQMRVGRKEEQPVHAASLLDFAWKPTVARADYLDVEMEADDGPYDTRDYQLLAEAVPLEGWRTFLHMGYSFSYGTASSLAMRLYLGTVARDKVGFTVIGRPPAGETPEYVRGMRGVAERNTMRYYLAIDAYLDSLSAPPGQQLDKRLVAWFDSTERYPRQLHEIEREAYLRMKRNEYRRQLEQP